ncbi:hypothetical protein, partial [Streptomyces sp. NPDC059909]|uniref:hypothetical protein n=1 Tax=Streptomyces sp. NPDC059909 TaxID=3346998 RepID=UPI003652C000
MGRADRPKAATGVITADWAALFPEYTARKLHLLRRVGPLVQGIFLERVTSGEEYAPVAHVHSLVRDFPVISLDLGTPRQDRVDARRHKDQFRAAAARLEATSSLPLREVPAPADVVRAYREHAVARQRGRLPAAVLQLEDSVLVAAAAGEHALANESMALVVELSQRWSKRGDWFGGQAGMGIQAPRPSKSWVTTSSRFLP